MGFYQILFAFDLYNFFNQFKFTFMQLAHKSQLCYDDETSEPKMYHHCVPYKDDQYSGWCYTRLHQNDSGVRTKSGNCDPSCYDHWDKMGKTNYNLASKDHNELWSENIFLIDSENAGHCHTYNPVNRSHAGSSGQFYSMLGRFSSILFAICI